jgi:hypothetical protein
MKLVITILAFVLSLSCEAQNQLDSLIYARKMETINGKVPTYYSPGSKPIAREFQRTILAAVHYYEKKYCRSFNIKLAVLDSTQWLHDLVPYGLVFYSDGWIVMNAGMDYHQFAKMYGLDANKAAEELKKQKLGYDRFVFSVYKFYSVHELGHYFIDALSNAKPPDNWTNEFVPTYLAYEFFKKQKSNDLKPMEIFSSIHKDHYAPKYSSIANFNKRYAAVGIPNFIWYHSNFYFLVKSLYDCKGPGFFQLFERTIRKNTEVTNTTKDIIGLLDEGCHGKIIAWANVMDAGEQQSQ